MSETTVLPLDLDLDDLTEEAHGLVGELVDALAENTPATESDLEDLKGELDSLVDIAIVATADGIDGDVSDDVIKELIEGAAEAITSVLDTAIDVLDDAIALPGVLDLFDGIALHMLVGFFARAFSPSERHLRKRSTALTKRADVLQAEAPVDLAEGKVKRAARKLKRAGNKDRRAARKLARADATA